MPVMDRSLWPETVKSPIKRLLFAMVGAPLIWGCIGTLIGFVIGGLSEPDGAGTLDYTIDIMLASLGFSYAFTFTLGILGVGVLILAKQTTAAAWALTGGLMGAVVAALITIVLPEQLNRGVLIFFVVMGWAMFLTIRWLARIKTP